MRHLQNNPRLTVGSKIKLLIVTLIFFSLSPVLYLLLKGSIEDDPSDQNFNKIADVIELWIDKELPNELSKKYALRYVSKTYEFYESGNTFEADKRHIDLENAKSCFSITFLHQRMKDKNYPSFVRLLDQKIANVQGNKEKLFHSLSLLQTGKFYGRSLEPSSILENAGCDFSEEEKSHIVKNLYPLVNKNRKRKLDKILKKD